jgi:hypothetical protein
MSELDISKREVVTLDFGPSKGTERTKVEGLMLTRPDLPCNFISSSLYALTSIKYIRKVMKEIYLNNLDSIDITNKIISSE